MKNAFGNANKMSENPFELSSMYSRMLVPQNQAVAKQYPWSRVDVSVPTSMKGATSNPQEAP